jgi:hypothetical protein
VVGPGPGVQSVWGRRGRMLAVAGLELGGVGGGRAFRAPAGGEISDERRSTQVSRP